MNGKIYIIKNFINNKVYIGQTIQDVSLRFKQHLKLLKSSQKQIIYKAIVTKGKDKFFVETLEDGIDNYQLLNSKEEFYIKKFNSLTPNGYNLCPGGQMWRVKSKIDNKIQQEIISIYLSGKSVRFISFQKHFSFSTILNVLKRNGIERRNKTCGLPDRTSKIDKEKLRKLYLKDGLSNVKIAYVLGVNESSIRRAIKRFGFTRI